MHIKIISCTILLFASLNFSQTMKIHLSGGNTEQISLHDIRKITFDLSGITAGNIAGLNKLKMVLANIYPNPFNSSMSLNYNVLKRAAVSIGIYDINGKTIRELKNSEMYPGQYNVNWNGKDSQGNSVSNGSYIAKINVAGKTVSKKLIFIK